MGDVLEAAGPRDPSTDAERARGVIAAAKAAGERQRLVIRDRSDRSDCSDRSDRSDRSDCSDCSDRSDRSTGVGSLSPIGLADLSTPGFVELLTRWRAEHPEAFASRFHVTAEGTDRWLRKQVIGNPDRILFLVRDIDFRPVGHLGIVLHSETALSAEVDAVLRGEKAAQGTMPGALRTLEHWAETQLGVADIWLRVLASNSRALRFYHRLGYSEVSREPLVSVRQDGVTRLVPGQAPITDEFVTMAR